MEWLVQCTALVLALFLAMTKSLRYEPSGLSDFELAARVKKGDTLAMREQQRRELLPTFMALRTFKTLALSIFLVALLVATHPIWIGIILAFAYYLLAEVAAAKQWLRRPVARVQQKAEALAWKIIQKVRPFVALLAPKLLSVAGGAIGSKQELQHLIATDSSLLSSDEKARLLAAFEFESLTIADIMVPRDKIVTVDISETVGPVLLDRLHKQKHEIFVVVKKDLDHVKGLLYMSDIATPHPDLNTVKDAVRAKVITLSGNAPLNEVLSASVKTGKQLFIIVDKDEKTIGLVTLKDVLAKVTGISLSR